MQRHLPGLRTCLPPDSVCLSSFLALHALTFQFPTDSGLCGQSHSVNVQGSWPSQFTVWAGTLLYSSLPCSPPGARAASFPSAQFWGTHSSSSMVPSVLRSSGSHSVAMEHRQLPDVLLQNGLNVH